MSNLVRCLLSFIRGSVGVDGRVELYVFRPDGFDVVEGAHLALAET